MHGGGWGGGGGQVWSVGVTLEEWPRDLNSHDPPPCSVTQVTLPRRLGPEGYAVTAAAGPGRCADTCADTCAQCPAGVDAPTWQRAAAADSAPDGGDGAAPLLSRARPVVRGRVVSLP
jgi:hypothetical protein